jgi:SPP1 family phage portal protein
MPYINQTQNVIKKIELEKLKSDSKLISGIIRKWEDGDARAQMIIGRDYYNGEHDITKKDFTTVQIFNKERMAFVPVKNENACDIPVENVFHQELMDQKADYVVGNRIGFKVKNSDKDSAAKKLEEDINNELNDYFEVTVHEWVIGSGNKGTEALLPFINSKGEFDYIITPAENIIPDVDESTGELLSFMRYYNVDNQDEHGKITKITRVEIWDKTEVRYFIKTENGEFVPDSPPSAGHFNYKKLIGDEVKGEAPAGWGRVPIIFLNNNPEKKNDLVRIKNNIDAYDSVKSDFFHDVDAIQQVIYHINDFDGADSSELVEILKLFKVAKTTGPDGKFEPKKIEIPFEAKDKILSLIEKDIYRFGKGVNIYEVGKMGGDLPIMAIKTLFAGLDLKANKTILQLKLALKEFIWFLIYSMQDKENPGNVSADKVTELSESVSAVITKKILINETEIISNLTASRGIMSNKNIQRKHPYIDDVEQNNKELEDDRKRALEEMDSLGVEQEEPVNE